ncbi:MAG TPA: hypothetical protein VF172_12290, partial [Nitrososphaera sp.]
MLKNTRKLLLTATAVSLVALLAVGLSSNYLLTPSLSQEPQVQPISRSYQVTDPDSFAKGDRSAIVVKAEHEKIELRRGESATISFDITHKAGPESFAQLHVTPTSFQGVALLPSTLEMTTIEERAKLAMEGKPIPGSIALSNLVRFSETNIALNAGETKTIDVTISLPSDLTEEVVGKSIHFAPRLEITEMVDAPP